MLGRLYEYQYMFCSFWTHFIQSFLELLFEEKEFLGVYFLKLRPTGCQIFIPVVTDLTQDGVSTSRFYVLKPSETSSHLLSSFLKRSWNSSNAKMMVLGSLFWCTLKWLLLSSRFGRSFCHWGKVLGWI